MSDKYEALRLCNQLCFPLYACSKEIVKRYKPFLDPLNLTYTQYIAMMVIWEEEQITVKELGKRLFLDSGTLTPVLKKLESKEFIERNRSSIDERTVIVTLTPKGRKLEDEAASVPGDMRGCVNLSQQESKTLYGLLYKMLGEMK